MKEHLRTFVGVMLAPMMIALTNPSCSNANTPLTITPNSLDALTCEAYDLQASGASGAVTWSVDPTGEGFGTIQGSGHYSAPMVVPKEPFDIVARSDGSEGRINVSMHTAHPMEVGHASLVVHDVEQRAVAVSGSRVYAAALDANNAVKLARSDDGGRTFGGAVVVGDMPAGVRVGCVTVAIDAGNPDVVYVTYQAMDNGGAFAKTTDVDSMSAGSTIALAVSEDKGASFTNYVLVSQNNEGYCTDIASPTADTVSLLVPTDDGDIGTGDDLHVYTYVDSNRGKGFSSGKIEPMAAYRVDQQYTPFLMQPIKKISSTGGTDGLESPSLFTNHKNKLCAVYWTDNQTLPHSYPIQVECSSDAGKTFDTPVTIFDTATKGDGSIIPLRPRGALSDDGTFAVIWAESELNVFVSTSPDGMTWSEPMQLNTLALNGAKVKGHHPTITWHNGTLWIAYQVDSGGADDAIVVDKSCDGGHTWSGNQIINESNAAILDRKYPALHLSVAGPLVSAHTASEDADLVFTSLTP